MLDKIKNLKWHFQLLILVSIASLMYLGVYYFVTSETRAETAVLNEEVAKLQAENAAAKMATEHIAELRSLYVTKVQEYDELKVLLPEQREITNVLQGLLETAKGSNLVVMRFTPKEDTQQDMIMAKPVEIEVDSNFNNLRAFYDAMAKLSRIVSITDFKITQLEKQSAQKTLHSQFMLTAYYAAPENLKPAAAPGQPGAAPINPASVPASPATPPAPAK
jgi:type IV pilus assembly protein PilO